MTAVIRRAVPADAAALAALRAAMFADMGEDVGGPDAAWRLDAVVWFERELRRVGEVAAFVAEVPDAGVVASALGLLEHPAPSPANPAGVRGHVSQVSTLPGHRRRGYARGCLVALLDWFEHDTAAGRLDLPQAHGRHAASRRVVTGARGPQRRATGRRSTARSASRRRPTPPCAAACADRAGRASDTRRPGRCRCGGG